MGMASRAPMTRGPTMASAAFAQQAAFISAQQLFQPAAEDNPSFDLDGVTTFAEGKEQAAVVDSSVVAFPAGTPLEVRDAVSDWLLFAQLAATKKFPDGGNTEGWSDEYLTVLRNTGWTSRQGVEGWTSERVVGSVVHEEILGLVTVVLGPVPAALAIVTAALRGLQNMDQRSRWITLFDRRGKRSETVGFSVASVEPQSNGGAALHSVDFRIEARKTMTQVLFFKFTDEEASMYRRGTVLTLSADALATLAPHIKDRVRDLALENIAAYDIGG